jgi:hypothetical protein
MARPPDTRQHRPEKWNGAFGAGRCKNKGLIIGPSMMLDPMIKNGLRPPRLRALATSP